jgi:hypothetical protein
VEQHKHRRVFKFTQAAENNGPMTFAHIGMMQAMNRHRVKEFTSRKTTRWGKRKLKRNQ